MRPSRFGHLPTAVAALAALFALAVSLLKICQHRALQTQAYDLGIYANVVWNTAHGRLFMDSIKGVNYLGDHFSPGLIVLAPLLWIWESAAALLVAQSAALAAAIPAVYLIAERKLGDKRLALGFGGWFALSPYVHRVSASDFHAVALALPLLAWALYFLDAGKKKPMLACLAVALSFQEDVALVAAGMGAYAALSSDTRGDRRMGIVLAAACLSLFALELFVLMPFFGGGWRPGHWGFYSALGDTPSAMFLALCDPRVWWRNLADAGKLSGLAWLLARSAGLCLLAPKAMLMVLAPLAYNILSGKPTQYQFDAHYSATMLPFLFYAMIHGYHRVSSRCWAVALLAAGPLIGLFHLPPYFHAAGLDRFAAARRVFNEVPRDEPVQASMNLVPHLSLRQKVGVLPGPLRASWTVLDLEQTGWDMPASYKAGAAEFAARNRDKLVLETNGLLLFRAAPSSR